MKNCIIKATLFCLLTRSCGLVYAADRFRWQINGNEIQLVDDQRTIKRSIELRHTKGNVGKETHAFVSEGGEFVAIGEQEVGSNSSTSTVTVIDSKEHEKWTMKAVDLDRGVHLSKDGKRALVVISEPDGCSEEDLECRKSVILLGENGNTVARFGPYRIVNQVEFTKNGEFGYVFYWNPGLKSDKYVFINSEGHVVAEKNAADIPGAPRLRDDGTVEYVKDTYETLENGKVPKIRKSEVIDHFNLK